MNVGAIRLDGKVAIIIGGAGSVGSATARLTTARGGRFGRFDLLHHNAAPLRTDIAQQDNDINTISKR